MTTYHKEIEALLKKTELTMKENEDVIKASNLY